MVAAKQLAPNLQLDSLPGPKLGDGLHMQHGDEAAMGRCDETPADLMTGLKFFGNRICPFAHRAWWAALEVEAPIEYVHVDMGSTHATGPNGKPWWYVNDISPVATVPTLTDHGIPYFAVAGTFEVDPVFDHIVKRGTQRLAPHSAADERRVRMFVAWLGGKKLVPLMYQLLSSRDSERTAALKKKLTSLLHDVNDKFAAESAGPFFLGDEVSQADMSIAPFFDRFEATLLHYRNYEVLPRADHDRAKLVAMMDACRTRAPFRATSQTPQFYVDAYKGYGGAPDVVQASL